MSDGNFPLFSLKVFKSAATKETKNYFAFGWSTVGIKRVNIKLELCNYQITLILTFPSDIFFIKQQCFKPISKKMYSTNKNYFKKLKIYTSKIILDLLKRNQQKIQNSPIKSTYFVIDPQQENICHIARSNNQFITNRQHRNIFKEACKA